MKFRLCLYLYPYLYLPPHREVCASASTCRRRVSETCAPWVCSGDGALLHEQDSLTDDLTARPRGRIVASGAHTPAARP